MSKQTLSVIRDGSCRHDGVSDFDFAEYMERYVRTWGGEDPPYCHDCKGYLYPHVEIDDETGDDVVRLYDQPYGADKD